MVWIKVAQDISPDKEDQVQETLNQDTGVIDAQLLQNWVCQNDGTGGYTSPIAALSASITDGNAVPIIGELLTSSVGTFTVTRVFPKRTGPYSFNVQVEAHWKYVPTPATNKSNVSISFSGQKFQQDAYQTSGGVAVVNSAGDSFDPTLPRMFYDEKIEISYTSVIEESEVFNSIRGCVNNASISFNIQGVTRTFAERQLLCEDVQESSSFQTSTGASTFQVKAQFTSRADLYITQVIDKGLYQIISGNRMPCLDNNGNEVKVAVNLNGSGVQQASTATPVWITFDMEAEADFTAAFTGLS